MEAVEFRALNLHQRVEWLRDLEPKEIDVVLAAAKSRRFPAKSVITLQGDPADQCFLLRDGRGALFLRVPFAILFRHLLHSMPFLWFVVCKDINFCSRGWNFHASPSSCS
jgi:hypothetical protein